MTQLRFNALAISNSNKSLADKLPLVKVAYGFVNSHPIRRNGFRIFIENFKGAGYWWHSSPLFVKEYPQCEFLLHIIPRN